MTSSDKTDCFYLCKSSFNTNNIYNDHWFAIKDSKNLIYIALVTFTMDQEQIKCSLCSEPKFEMKFCHNDAKYFCVSCDDEFHNKSNFQIMKKHRRTNYISFSILYQGTCSQHSLKPYEFYCLSCRAIYCIKCMELDHSNSSDHEVKYLHEIVGSIDQESKSLYERIKQINHSISSELEEREKNAKEIQKLIQQYENSLYERKRKALIDIDTEVLSRNTYLASVTMELQRIVSEIDSKITFLRNINYNSDCATYINLSNVFNKYMKEEVFHNIEMLININLEGISSPFYLIEKKEQSDLFKINK